MLEKVNINESRNSRYQQNSDKVGFTKSSFVKENNCFEQKK